VVYKAEKDACRAFPDPQADGLESAAQRNFQILSPLEVLAEFTQHIPPKGSHLVRYYGWYSNKSRGMQRKAAGSVEELPGTVGAEEASPRPSSQSWAMPIKRVYEVDPLSCPECGGQMAVVAFIEPPQADVIEKILQHCGLWRSSAPRAPPATAHREGMEVARRSDSESNELTYIDTDTFLANF